VSSSESTPPSVSSTSSTGELGFDESIVNTPIWSTFIAELEQHLQVISPVLSSAEPLHDAENLRVTKRTLHTIKSSAMVVPVTPVSAATHEIENLLDVCQSGTIEFPQALAKEYVEGLAGVVQQKRTPMDPLCDLALLTGTLRNLCSQATSA
ncbi:MAG: Hpt domain-containing protein, partial [Planctomycetales bacterium]|nr:Hpt domain-containing protein [Planctomycetales bacterium]